MNYEFLKTTLESIHSRIWIAPVADKVTAVRVANYVRGLGHKAKVQTIKDKVFWVYILVK